MKFMHEAADSLGPARAPEGRFHYNGQRALYLSATPEGCFVASRAYMKPDDPPRGIFPLHVTGWVVDLRSQAATEHFGIDVTHRAAQWQEFRKNGQPAPTWSISDHVRDAGLDGMLYASRTDPTKTHLTLFRWNTGTSCHVRQTAPAELFSHP